MTNGMTGLCSVVADLCASLLQLLGKHETNCLRLLAKLHFVGEVVVVAGGVGPPAL